MRSSLMTQFEELETLRHQLTGNLRALDGARLQARPRADAWCALEIVSHLMTAERHSLAYVRKKLNDPASIPEAGIGAHVRSTLLRIALALPFRFKAPEVVSKPECPESLESAVTAWDEVRDGWRTLLDTLPPELESKAIFRHPVVGRINLSDTLQFHRSHLQRHCAQIERAIG